MADNFVCPVCGWPALVEPPRSALGGGSYEICPSCGFEYGYTDEDQGHTYESWREQWVAGGMRWWSPSRPVPAGWDPRAQLDRLLRNDA